MKLKKRITNLENEIKELKGIIQKDSITLTDPTNPKQTVVTSFRSGVLSTDKITTETTVIVTTENITDEKNSN